LEKEDNMSEDIYKRLRKEIGRRGVGYQATTSGVELKFLRKLFTEEEAEMYLHLTDRLEAPEQIAERAMMDPDRVAEILKRMAEKGLVFPKRKGDKAYYAAAPYAHGIYEHQVNRLDRELAQLHEDYVLAEKVPDEPAPDVEAQPGVPMRTIPVKAPVNISRPVAPYESVKEIIKNQDRIVLTNCVCAQQQSLLESGCNQPVEVCLIFGFYAEYYVDHGMGRWITQEEALGVLDVAEEAGLVHQVPNSLDPAAICNCCPDCCGALRFIKMAPNPAAFIPTDHFAQVDVDLCNACVACVDRCPMEAISITATEVASINLERCIGCGLCINSCPTGALVLALKPEEIRQEPPSSIPFMRNSRDMESTIV